MQKLQKRLPVLSLVLLLSSVPAFGAATALQAVANLRGVATHGAAATAGYVAGSVGIGNLLSGTFLGDIAVTAQDPKKKALMHSQADLSDEDLRDVMAYTALKREGAQRRKHDAALQKQREFYTTKAEKSDAKNDAFASTDDSKAGLSEHKSAAAAAAAAFAPKAFQRSPSLEALHKLAGTTAHVMPLAQVMGALQKIEPSSYSYSGGSGATHGTDHQSMPLPTFRLQIGGNGKDDAGSTTAVVLDSLDHAYLTSTQAKTAMRAALIAGINAHTAVLQHANQQLQALAGAQPKAN